MMQNQAYIDINNRLSTFFRSVDERAWQNVLDVFDENVFVDYSSFNGLDAATLAREAVVKGWSEFLPLFDATHHQIGNIEIRMDGEQAQVKCYGTATHFKKKAVNGEGEETQQVIGTYDIAFVQRDGIWHIGAITFNFAFQTGNPNLLNQPSQ